MIDQQYVTAAQQYDGGHGGDKCLERVTKRTVVAAVSGVFPQRQVEDVL